MFTQVIRSESFLPVPLRCDPVRSEHSGATSHRATTHVGRYRPLVVVVVVEGVALPVRTASSALKSALYMQQ